MGSLTLPKAPLPTLRRRTKWKRFTSPSKSMGWRSRAILALETESRRRGHTSGRQQTPPMCLLLRDYKIALGVDKQSGCRSAAVERWPGLLESEEVRKGQSSFLIKPRPETIRSLSPRRLARLPTQSQPTTIVHTTVIMPSCCCSILVLLFCGHTTRAASGPALEQGV
jgi:hypothetical protein